MAVGGTELVRRRREVKALEGKTKFKPHDPKEHQFWRLSAKGSGVGLGN